MGTPGSPPTRLTAVPDKWVRPIRRPADLSSGPNQPSWQHTQPLEDHFRRLTDDLNQDNLKTWRTRQNLNGFRLSRSTGCGKSCNVDLGLQVVTDQESRNQPHPLANIRWARRLLYHHAILKQSTPITRRRVLLSGGPYQYKLTVFSVFPYSCATFEFLALDSTPPNN
jgi:hypothetical protein